MSIRKIIPVILVALAVGLSLAACSARDGVMGGTVTPAPTADYAPGSDNAASNGTAQNGNNTVPQNGGAAGLTGGAASNPSGAAGNTGAAGSTATTADGVLNPFDWANGAAEIEKAIGRISELSEARVVVTGSTALVGVKFDSAYKGEITERIREMVAAEVLKADPNIQTVAVTANAEDVQKVYDLSEKIRAGRTADELSAEINAIVRNATTMR